ncbi:MAG: thioredoxin family protein [Chloroflexota bacterium]
MAKPIVDGIEQDLAGQARVIRLSLLSELGREAARRYGVRGVPTLVIFDGRGQVVQQTSGIPNRQEVVDQVNRLLPGIKK